MGWTVLCHIFGVLVCVVDVTYDKLNSTYP